ncbi:MAG TPA: anaerobic sulfatase maturase [Candidatus Limnocylindrales bacterium]|nr:anaerobic sulfatase maturase [Candidatus Limnocylindrales bacterium]
MDPTRTFTRQDLLTGRPGSSPAPVSPAAPDPRPRGAPPAFHVLAKPTGAVCNLDCTYCFFLSKEALYPGSAFRMRDDLLDQYIRQLLEAHEDPHVTITWQGGEPTLMGLDFFRRAMAAVERHRRPGVTVEHAIQTNGTRLDAAWCEFFREHGFLVGLSMDGPPEMHDAYRVDKGGAPTHARVLDAARLLAREGVEFNVLCTVHAANADHPLELYRYFRDEVGTRYLQLIPIVERATPATLDAADAGWGAGSAGRPLYVVDGAEVTRRSVRPGQWGRFLTTIFDEWVTRDVGTVFVQLFDAALASWVGVPPSLCIFGETCGNALALEHTGDLYSCDHYVEPRYLLGNIRDRHLLDMVASPEQRAFGEAKRDTLPRYCRECPVRFACHGECPRNRFIATPDGEPGLNYLCEGYRSFFTHIDRPMRLMAGLLRQGRYADETMTILRAEREAEIPATGGPSRPGSAPPA